MADYGRVDRDVEDGRGRGSGGMSGRTVGVIVVAAAIVGVVLGAIAVHNLDGAEDGDGVYLTRVNSICIPSNATALYQTAGSRVDQLNISNAQYKFTGHSVELSFNFFQPFVMDAPAADQDFRIYVNALCLPPSDAFRTCTDPCPDAATSDDQLLNYSNPAYNAFFQGGVVSDYSLEDDQDYSPDIFFDDFVQGLVGEDLYYGSKLTLRIPAAATGNVVVSNMRLWLTYGMHTHLDWKIPDFCLDGPCFDADLA
jgi:hypothetical protein